MVATVLAPVHVHTPPTGFDALSVPMQSGRGLNISGRNTTFVSPIAKGLEALIFGQTGVRDENTADAISSVRSFGKKPFREISAARLENGVLLDDISRTFSCVPLKEILRLEAGKAIGSSGKNVLEMPSARNSAANYDPARLKETGVTVLLTGMTVSDNSFQEYVESTKRVSGKPVFCVVNDQESFFGRDRKPYKLENIIGEVVTGVLGMIDPHLGALAEPSVEVLANLLLRLSKEGIPVQLIAHSKGGILLSNALSLLREHLPEKEWKMITDNVSGEVVGSIQRRYPPEMRLSHRSAVLDPLFRLGEPIDLAKSTLFPDRNKTASLGEHTTAGFSHDFDKAIRNFPKFIVSEETRGGKYYGFNGIRLANRVLEGISNARYADDVWHGVLEEVGTLQSNPKNRAFIEDFARTMREAAPDGVLGAFRFTPMEREFLGITKTSLLRPRRTSPFEITPSEMALQRSASEADRFAFAGSRA